MKQKKKTEDVKRDLTRTLSVTSFYERKITLKIKQNEKKYRKFVRQKRK